MPFHVLIVPDKFKGTLTAQAAASAIASGWRQHRPADTIELLPMSDGGDGFGEVMAPLIEAEPRSASVLDAAHRPCRAAWWWAARSRTALIESARVVGLALFSHQSLHPFALDTMGLADLIRAGDDAQAVHCLIGIGGSATNDGGFGLARGLGWSFLREDESEITRWTELNELSSLKKPTAPTRLVDIVVAVDVQNPLLGPFGASRIYGPQKGLRPEDMGKAEACLSRLAEVAERALGASPSRTPGSGAAGGLGFGLHTFLGARIESGFDLFAKYADLETRIQKADLVITGEGSIDSSSVMGKGVGEVARLSSKCGVPCIGLAGTLDSIPLNQTGHFAELHGICPALATTTEAKAKPDYWLNWLAAEVASKWKG